MTKSSLWQSPYCGVPHPGSRFWPHDLLITVVGIKTIIITCDFLALVVCLNPGYLPFGGRHVKKMREYFNILESRAPCTLNSLSTEMHRKTQWWQDKVKSQSCIHSAPCRLQLDKAQLGIWFMPFISNMFLLTILPRSAKSLSFTRTNK